MRNKESNTLNDEGECPIQFIGLDSENLWPGYMMYGKSFQLYYHIELISDSLVI